MTVTYSTFKPGQLWNDNRGKHISAHGGGILVHEGIYYWYGEDNSEGYLNNVGVSCYSSTDLYNWKYEGTALRQEDMPEELQGKNNGRVERPKVIYNTKTKKFVMWMHAERSGYAFSSAGVAISDSPTGPFTFLFYDRPVLFQPENGFDKHTNEEELGNSFRDMHVFVDDVDSNGDGVNDAYVYYASEGNWTLYIVRLNSDYTWVDLPDDPDRVRPQCTEKNLGEVWSRQFIRKMREAPTPFKYKEKYYIISSACTGWKPNQAEYAIADKPLGDYQTIGDPCVGDDDKTTFHSQSTFVLPIDKKNGKFIYIGDRWTPDELGKSLHIWLPLEIDDNYNVTIRWQDEWELSELK
ncbi:glycoside hydrolase family 43 protein [Caldibacillus lycopersici]|uniref:Glycoside hydrolase family 43 protein n=1 Tax=Perspicuibacillus lycopersici TaxID=1325689 RepID=A0AAE3IS48_9BACI|nr:glycoside hydrolase family 43 protein [Perspicuibacillus lycopersici]MCU9612633.1 glycoside hydrolase family 43 protein [Perspicuibacillus lycopersici]